MAIMVTGAAGFIGSHLSDFLLKNNENVVGIDNFDQYYDEETKRKNLSILEGRVGFKFQLLDVRNPNLSKSMKDHGIEKICHLAARPGVRPSLKDPFIYEEINVKGTLNTLEAARKADVKQFVFVSSSSVYGNCKQIPWKEEYVPQPASPYGASKLAGEAYVRTYAELYGMKTSCLRYFSVYGPRQRPDLALAKFSIAIMKGDELPVFGDGSALRDYTYISDIVEGTASALNKSFTFEIFNLGDSNPVRLDKLISLLEKECGRRAKIKRLPIQEGDLKNTYADISKAKKMLDYSPKVKIEQGIKKYFEWLKSK
ncbi:MAG: GDP-mannose 4,6-dehydratase [Candidatus Micrarchaeota archaeon]